jgi:Holliday junction resolvase RusA-like endonuclease
MALRMTKAHLAKMVGARKGDDAGRLLRDLLSEAARAPKRRPAPQKPAQTATDPLPPLIVSVAGLPPTVNHMYIARRGGGRTLSAEACAWYDHAIPAIKAGAVGYAVPDGALRLTIVLYSLPRSRDLDNALKASQDAIAKALGFDDKRIAYLTVARGTGRPARTVYTLEAL